MDQPLMQLIPEIAGRGQKSGHSAAAEAVNRRKNP
jgi:hypothetical protein